MSALIYSIAILLGVVALCGNYFCGKSGNLFRSYWFDLSGGVAVALAYLAGKLA